MHADNTGAVRHFNRTSADNGDLFSAHGKSDQGHVIIMLVFKFGFGLSACDCDRPIKYTLAVPGYWRHPQMLQAKSDGLIVGMLGRVGDFELHNITHGTGNPMLWFQRDRNGPE